MADRPAFRTQWNEPRGQIHTRCRDCGGDGVVIAARAYLNGEVVHSVQIPQACPSCRGKRCLPGLQPPA